MSEWQPIETAPKDGSPVLLGSEGGGWVEQGYYEADTPSRGGWYMTNTHWTDATDGEIHPSAWMPLPSPP